MHSKRPDIREFHVVAAGSYRPHVLYEITRQLSQTGCKISESQYSSSGDLFFLSMVLYGHWSHVAKAETVLEQMKKYKLEWFQYYFLDEPPQEAQDFPYTISLSGPEHPALLARMIEFLTAFPIRIHHMNVETYQSKPQFVKKINIEMKVSLKKSISIGEWREQFIIFCDSQNLDVFLEPTKY